MLHRLEIFILFLVVFSSSFFTIFSSETLAAPEDYAGMANTVPIQDSGASPGSIVSSTSTGYRLSNKEYDSKIYGVITNTPGVAIEDIPIAGTRYVVYSGQTRVLVTTKNGEIKRNDLITTSETPGVGTKATLNGFVVGVALEGYSGNGTGLILVSVSPHYNDSFPNSGGRNIFEVLRKTPGIVTLSPLDFLRYIIAAIVIIVSFIFGFTHFGRVAQKGVEAVGRNPLAGRIIETSVIVNVLLTALIIIAGITVAYMILIF